MQPSTERSLPSFTQHTLTSRGLPLCWEVWGSIKWLFFSDISFIDLGLDLDLDLDLDRDEIKFMFGPVTKLAPPQLTRPLKP